ncbi:MAG: DUF58 domain-containing protein [Bacteroidetes bacterium]|jgi:uncharacterized protein (DUF58 family)|nr:DUF58 domain-containing protein [Bacteroidota bacterium]
MVQDLKYLDPLVISRLKNMEVKARMIVEGFITGLHKSPYHGFSVEFAEHRPYNTGEGLRSVDWKVYARTDKLFTKKYEEETNLLCTLVLDTSDSMRYPVQAPDRLSKLEYGAYLCAALSYLMIQQKDAAGLALFDQRLHFYAPPRAKRSYLVPMLSRLQEVAAQVADFTHTTSTPEVLHQLATRIRRRGLVVLITDLLGAPQDVDQLFPALQHLRHGKHEVLIFHLLDAETESRFQFPNTPLLLKDLESGETLRVLPHEIRDQYQELMLAYQQRVKKKCRELEIDLIEVDIRQPYDKALTDYLIKRRKLTRK